MFDDDLRLVAWWERTPLDDYREPLPHELARYLATSEGRIGALTALERAGMPVDSWIDNQELRRVLAHAIDKDLLLVAITAPRLRTAPAPSGPARPEPQERVDVPWDAEAAPLHWIEISMVGEDGNPVPGVRYELELPNGRMARGRLDDLGRARVDGIEHGGECRVRFPDLDGDAWQRAG